MKITPGSVSGIREGKLGIRADVTLAADSEHGYAIVTVTPRSAAVQSALVALKVAISKETEDTLSNVLAGQKKWDHERANA